MTSVVIPVFNGASIVPVTAPAVLALDGVDEWIWVDDGSNDGTATALASMTEREPRARIVRLESNRGRSAARNAGIAAAHGDTLVFLDADVEPPRDAVHALTEAAHLGGAVAGVGRVVPVLDVPDDPYQDYLAHYPRGPARDHPPERPLDWRFFLSGACAIQRGALDEVGGFRADVGYGEDVDLACRLARTFLADCGSRTLMSNSTMSELWQTRCRVPTPSDAVSKHLTPTADAAPSVA